MLTDPIADMLTRIRNANRVARFRFDADSCMKEIARILKEEGYIADYRVVERTRRRAAAVQDLVVELKFARDRRRVITDLKRVSKPGRRMYAGVSSGSAPRSCPPRPG